MKKAVVLSLCLITIAALFAAAQDDFQTARVVAFERVPGDVQHPEKSDGYKMSMRFGDMVYNCKANAPVAVFNDWTIGKEFPARVNEKAKVMQVKNFDGQLIDLTITGKKRPK
ncbi:MAG TPA: hypothetical protein VG897_03130 [Terriglobales bacterium]|nr:hypothetical protein [Terriglobales bacterium]